MIINKLIIIFKLIHKYLEGFINKFWEKILDIYIKK